MTDGGTCTWKLLCGLGAYRGAYEAHAETPAFDEAAFPVRAQSGADLAARDPWWIDAWESPFARATESGIPARGFGERPEPGSGSRWTTPCGGLVPHPSQPRPFMQETPFGNFARL